LAIKTNQLFIFLLIFSVVFIIFFEPYIISIEQNSNKRVANIEIYQFDSYKIDTKITEQLHATTAYQFDDVIEFYQLRVDRELNNENESIIADNVTLFKTNYVFLKDNIIYKNGRGNKLIANNIKYDFNKKIVSSNDKFEIYSQKFNFFGKKFDYNIDDKKFVSDGIRLKVKNHD